MNRSMMISRESGGGVPGINACVKILSDLYETAKYSMGQLKQIQPSRRGCMPAKALSGHPSHRFFLSDIPLCEHFPFFVRQRAAERKTLLCRRSQCASKLCRRMRLFSLGRS